MDNLFALPFIDWLQTFSSEALSLFLLTMCCGAILLLLRSFGIAGLFLYNTIAVVVANIQVLKLSHFWFFSEPLALGTIVFATTYLVSDILTEFYGRAIAQRGIWLCFCGQILLVLMMLLTLGYSPAPQDTGHNAMMVLFTPSIRLLTASLIAFVMSQFVDIWVFQGLSRWTRRRFLGFRATLAFLFSALMDNFIFSILAWNLLSSEPLGFKELMVRYVWGTYLARMVVGGLSLPTLYLCRYFVPRKDKESLVLNHAK